MCVNFYDIWFSTFLLIWPIYVGIYMFELWCEFFLALVFSNISTKSTPINLKSTPKV